MLVMQWGHGATVAIVALGLEMLEIMKFPKKDGVTIHVQAYRLL